MVELVRNQNYCKWDQKNKNIFLYLRNQECWNEFNNGCIIGYY